MPTTKIAWVGIATSRAYFPLAQFRLTPTAESLHLSLKLLFSVIVISGIILKNLATVKKFRKTKAIGIRLRTKGTRIPY